MNSEVKDKPRIGIIMPAYNQGLYIDEAIKSLKLQTFQNFIVHIVDDGSDDGITPAKLKKIKYDKANIFHNKTNKGVVYRQLEHYKIINTEYVVIICGDDKIAPTFLEETIKFLDENDDYGAVGTDIQHFGDNEIYISLDADKCKLPDMLFRNAFLGSALMRKKALDQLNLKAGTRYQDWERWIGMLSKGWKLGVINKPLFYYRKHSQSLSATANIDQELKVSEFIFNNYSNLYIKYYKDLFLAQQKEYLCFEEVWRAKEYLSEQRDILDKDNIKLKEDLLETKNHNVEIRENINSLKNENSALKHELEIIYKKPHIYLYKKIKRLFK